MMHLRIALATLVLSLLSPVLGVAADNASESGKRGPKTEEFYRIHAEMNSLLADLADLQVQYRTANEDKQATIKQQWNELIEQGKALEPKLIETAQKAYTESPNADKGIADFLAKLLAQAVQRDDYEPVAEIGKLLVENKYPGKCVANYAGIVAFALNDFDTAEKYLTLAAQQGCYQSLSKDDKIGQLGAVFSQPQLLAAYKEAWAAEKAIREKEAKADNLPRVLLKTTKGDIVIELFEDQAPNTVANFIQLVKKGFYKGLAFHRVLQGFMAQGGDPAGNGSGGPGYSIACECYRPDARRHFRGTLSMAHAGRDTGGSQFFLTFVPTPHLDGKHTAFGRVIDGMDVLAKLQRRDPSDAEAPRPDKIIDAKVLRKRPHEYIPKKMPE
jgi:cyclophilin family peptidyl-prolyl cis-trans isomerase